MGKEDNLDLTLLILIKGDFMLKLQKEESKLNLFAFFVFVACSVFLFWKAKYGYIFNDEPFMVTLGHRLIKGDKLFVNEYNLAQMIGLLQAPFVWIFTAVTKSTNGLILFIRYMYVVWWILTSIILYLRLKQYGWISLVAVLYYALFTPLDEMSLTYNAMALSCIMLFSTYFLVDGNRLKDYLTGLVLSLSVIAYPYMVLLYIIWAFSVVIINTVFKKRVLNPYRIFDIKKFLRISSVCGLCAVVLLIFIFSAGSGSVISSLKIILSSRASSDISKSFIGLLYLVLSLERYLRLLFVAAVLILVVSLLDRNRYKRKLLYFSVQSLIWSCSIAIIIIKQFLNFNVVMLPVSFLGIQALVLTKKRNWLLFLSLGLTGIIYSYIAFISSDTGLKAISTGSVPLGIAAWILIYDFYKESEIKTKTFKPIPIILLCGIIFVQLFGQMVLKIQRNYWDEKTENLNSVISVGAANGIITTYNNKTNYENVYDDIEKIKQAASGEKNLNFLSLSLFPSIYLDLDYNYATYSSWTYFQNSKNFERLNERLKRYYSSCPNKVPDCIYILNDDLEFLELLDFTDFSEYTKHNLKSGVLFMKN